jgi:hypothetical protein
MNDLNSRARAVIEAARDADEPSLADRDRIKHAVLVQVAAGIVASTAAAGTVTVGMSLGMKVGLAVLAVSLVGGGSAGFVHWQGKQRTSNVATSTPWPKAVARAATPVPVEIPAVAPPVAASPAPTENKARRLDKPRKLVGQGSDELVSQEDQLNAEVAVLKRAREELRLGRPNQALEALLEYDRRFGKGALGEERQAIAAIAACQAHPGPSARAQAQAFMHSSPKSPLLDRVRAACITPIRAGSP